MILGKTIINQVLLFLLLPAHLALVEPGAGQADVGQQHRPRVRAANIQVIKLNKKYSHLLRSTVVPVTGKERAGGCSLGRYLRHIRDHGRNTVARHL